MSVTIFLHKYNTGSWPVVGEAKPDSKLITSHQSQVESIKSVALHTQQPSWV